MERATFRVTEYSYHGRKRWRLRIPARFSSTGKEVALYYTTKQDAERDAVALRAKHSGGSLLAADLLAPDAVRDARTALAKLAAAGSHMSLTDAVTLALDHAAMLDRSLSVTDMFERYAADVSAARAWSTKYRATWRQYSTRFAATFGPRLCATITAQELREWYAATYPSATSYNSAMAVVAPCFAWAVKQELMDRSPFLLLERRKIVQRDAVDVFTVDECRRLLDAAAAAGPDTLRAFAILLFAGIRPNELTQLTWADIHPEGNGLYIHVRPSVAKTRSVRLVSVRQPLLANLTAALRCNPSGKLIPTDWKRIAASVRKTAGLQFRPDAPRHSFASYLLASGATIQEVQSDMGHTKGSDMLFKHYRAAVTPEQAAAFWALPLVP